MMVGVDSQSPSTCNCFDCKEVKEGPYVGQSIQSDFGSHNHVKLDFTTLVISVKTVALDHIHVIIVITIITLFTLVLAFYWFDLTGSYYSMGEQTGGCLYRFLIGQCALIPHISVLQSCTVHLQFHKVTFTQSCLHREPNSGRIIRACDAEVPPH